MSYCWALCLAHDLASLVFSFSQDSLAGCASFYYFTGHKWRWNLLICDSPKLWLRAVVLPNGCLNKRKSTELMAKITNNYSLTVLEVRYSKCSWTMLPLGMQRSHQLFLSLSASKWCCSSLCLFIWPSEYLWYLPPCVYNNVCNSIYGLHI